MNKQELWSAYVARNPSFAKGGNVTMTADGLKKLFDQTWDMAEKHCSAKSSNGASLFDQVFGKR